MQEPGHIYVMVNPSMEGLVKVGKTTRDPEFRAKELSQATGVATPFYVVFSIQVKDCHAAERFVHEVLEFNGFRNTSNREFFQIPVKRAVEVLLLAEKEFQRPSFTSAQEQASESSDQTLEDSEIEEHPGKAVYEKAIKTYYGWGDELEDVDEAVGLLRSAIALNFPAAFTSLAHHYVEQADMHLIGTGELNDATGRSSRESALAILKEGASKGHGRCWVALAYLFAAGSVRPDGKPDLESAKKCWKRYFQSETFRRDDDRKWTRGCDGLVLEIAAQGAPRTTYAEFFLQDVTSQQYALDPEMKSLLQPIKDEVLSSLTSAAAYGDESGDADYARKSRELADFVKRTL